MRLILALIAKPAQPDHRAIFHAFAERLARVLRHERPLARVRAVEG
jgi:hypothetical protein